MGKNYVISTNLIEPELVTVVIRLRAAEGEARESSGSGYLVADAVKLDPEDELE